MRRQDRHPQGRPARYRLDRLKAYHEQTEPLVAFYRERGKLAVIPFCPSIEETTAEVMKALEA